MRTRRSLTAKRVFGKVMEQVKSGQRINIKKAALEVGYAPSTARSLEFTRSKTWQECINKLDDTLILEEFRKIAMNSTDLRAKLEAGKEIFKLKNRYPAARIRMREYQEELGYY